MAQELPAHPEYLSSPPVISGVRVARAIVFCVIFCRSMIVRFFFFLLAIILCHSSIYGI